MAGLDSESESEFSIENSFSREYEDSESEFSYYQTIHKEQDGGKFAALSKLGSVLSKSSDKITRGLTKAGDFAEKGLARAEQAQTMFERGLTTAEELTNRAEDLSSRTSGIADQISTIYQTYSPLNSDLNYSEPSLSTSAPLSPNSGQNFQSFGDYICINKAFVRDLRTLYNELFARRNDI